MLSIGHVSAGKRRCRRAAIAHPGGQRLAELPNGQERVIEGGSPCSRALPAPGQAALPASPPGTLMHPALLCQL